MKTLMTLVSALTLFIGLSGTTAHAVTVEGLLAPPAQFSHDEERARMANGELQPANLTYPYSIRCENPVKPCSKFIPWNAPAGGVVRSGVTCTCSFNFGVVQGLTSIVDVETGARYQTLKVTNGQPASGFTGVDVRMLAPAIK